ncbi:MAG: glycine zipper domain-containing protein [Chlamydiota bacterium]
MKKTSPILILSLAGLLFIGCESKAGTGAVTGGALGLGVGAIAGGGAGAAIGAGTGAIAGGLIGASLDAQDQRSLKEESSQTYRRVDQGERLSVNDVIHLSNAGISDRKIIGLIQKTNSHFTLNSYQIDKLRDAGVSETVITHMMYNT